MVISDQWISRVKAAQPQMRTEKISYYMEAFGLPRYDAELITGSKRMADLFEETAAICGRPKEVSNWLMVEAMRLLKEHEMDPDRMHFTPAHLAALIGLVEQNVVNRNVAKTVFEEIFLNDVDPERYVEEKGLKVVSDEGALRAAVEAVLEANPQSVAMTILYRKIPAI